MEMSGFSTGYFQTDGRFSGAEQKNGDLNPFQKRGVTEKPYE